MIKTTKTRMVFYGRVSTAHETQLSALKNQMQWYNEKLNEYSHEWDLVAPINTYIDRGITGTQAKKRPRFIELIEDAKKGKFELIVTREVCRFARNTKEALEYVHMLRNIGVEVFFVSDEIKTISGKDCELKLTLMAALAQEESRKISERALAGQYISRKNGVLYGTDLVLGYKRIRKKSDVDKRNRIGDKAVPTFEIVPEEATTVRMIFEYYLKGYGLKRLKVMLEQNNRKTSVGNTVWHVSTISRILDNPMYVGKQYQCKTTTVDFLSGKKVKNPKEEWVLIEGDFEPILDEETFDAVQKMKTDRKKNNNFVGIENAGRPSDDKWISKLECDCGSRFKQYHWRTDKVTGDFIKGYTCGHRITNGSESYRIEHGLPTDGACSMKSIPDWHLELMALKVFAAAYGDRKESIIRALSTIEQFADGNDRDSNISELIKNKHTFEKKMDKLIELYTDGGVSKDVYLEKKNEYQENIDYYNETIQKMEDITTKKNKQKKIKQIIKSLEQVIDTTGKKYCDEGIVKNGVDKVIMRTPYEFEWLINISGDASDFTDENYRIKHNSALDVKRENTMKMRDALYFPMFTFIINYDDAREYRKTWSKYLRTNQWEDIKVSVYIR